jgi:DNA-binding FrmR family transcriptional regulator
MTTEEDTAYKRGMLDATVAEHTKHLSRINGSLETISKQLNEAAHAMLIAAQQAASRDAIAVHTAQVVKETRQETIDKAEARWKPWQKVLAVIVALAAVFGAVLAFLRH